MKKFFLLAAAMIAAISMNAKVVDIDLSKHSIIKSDGATVAAAVADGVLKIDYTITAGWDDVAGVSFAFDKQKVTNMAFEFLGDDALEGWTSLFVYLEDEDGLKWINNAADLHISGWDGQWSQQSYFPQDCLWNESPDHAAGDKPFVAIGFMASGANATASYSIRNVKLTVEESTAVETVAAQENATKIMRNGQVLILRDGKTFDMLGAEVK